MLTRIFITRALIHHFARCSFRSMQGKRCQVVTGKYVGVVSQGLIYRPAAQLFSASGSLIN